MDYKEQRAFEKTLTTAQRRKIRTLESLYEESITPIRNAHWKRYEEVKCEAFVTINGEQRIKEIRQEFKPQMEAISEQIRQLNEQYIQLQTEAQNKEEAVRDEIYVIAGNDPQVLATGEIWKEMKETYAKKKEELFASLQK